MSIQKGKVANIEKLGKPGDKARGLHHDQIKGDHKLEILLINLVERCISLYRESFSNEYAKNIPDEHVHKQLMTPRTIVAIATIYVHVE